MPPKNERLTLCRKGQDSVRLHARQPAGLEARSGRLAQQDWVAARAVHLNHQRRLVRRQLRSGRLRMSRCMDGTAHGEQDSVTRLQSMGA